ncbi:hypothetical protein TGS27_1771 [Geobacillus stearothermophilus]|uniref:Uncharacterized protein n=1 Tax=Geobacillus stearothermophilus TaxID=1422 RepID=A0A150NET2_GEOSE|nr:hypothetical protein GS8_1804 [Geobacillus stearothermophilus]KYD27274.1 hypothetical protein B4109_0644 [Geobacillus stearothermophilus]KYD35188.1 hypothetical protein B4114_0486 [Geobacillus stearothermophilus]OAO81069.1 hypothetical protein TGS27_1771 [Geobacillus stearothermophilus]
MCHCGNGKDGKKPPIGGFFYSIGRTAWGGRYIGSLRRKAAFARLFSKNVLDKHFC